MDDEKIIKLENILKEKLELIGSLHTKINKLENTVDGQYRMGSERSEEAKELLRLLGSSIQRESVYKIRSERLKDEIESLQVNYAPHLLGVKFKGIDNMEDMSVFWNKKQEILHRRDCSELECDNC